MEKERQNNILAHNLKDQVRNLAVEYNTYSDARNKQNNTLNKYNLYLSLQNEKLNHHLNELKNIESKIATRDSLIRGNQMEYENKRKKIHVAKIFFLLMGYLVFVIIAYLGKKIDLPMLLLNFIAVLLIYSIYVAWVFNFFFFKKFSQYVDRDFERARKEIYNDINQYIYGNCDCSSKNLLK